MREKQKRGYFSTLEKVLWFSSVFVIIVSFILFDRINFMTLCASIIGVSSLIFNAKGNPVGQVLMIVFSVFYGIISFSFSYYGEMITYLGMTAPMALIALIAWLKNPYKNKRSEVAVNGISKKETVFMLILSAVVTIFFYYVLKAFNTANLIPSTLSVTTSFMAAYLTFRRSSYFAFCYALNDIVLIVLWFLAAMKDISYVSVTVCFAAFLVNDMYGFFSWKKMQKRQSLCQ